MKKRILSCLMALALCLTLLPTAALAEEPEGTAQMSPAVEEAADPANGKAKQENQPAEQEEQQEDSATKQDEDVAAVQAMIDALPDAAELDGMDDEDAMAVYEAFQAACEAYYDTLAEEQQAQLKNTEKLAALSDWFSQPETLAAGEHQNHCVCGATHTSIGDHTAESQITFNKWLASTASRGYILDVGEGNDTSGTGQTLVGDKYVLPAGDLPADNYYLKGDVKVEHPIQIKGTVTICLNGHTIQSKATDKPVFEVVSGGTLTLTDCQGNKGKVTHFSDGTGCGVEVNGGKFNLYGGKITGNTAATGGGVKVTGGTVNMYGGEIADNKAAGHTSGTGNGGGVYVSGGTFNMRGGSITNNTTEVYSDGEGNGGGMYVSGGTFNLYDGGSITRNKATGNASESKGGGVRVGSYGQVGTFNMYGGEIANNTANYGGGVDVYEGTFTMSGGNITNNTTGGPGGGVYVDRESCTFIMSGGEIGGNTAGSGGGVYVYSDTFTMSGGEITGNKATSNGGGVYVNGSDSVPNFGGKFTVSGKVTITGNKKGSADNNVYLVSANKPIIIGVNGLDASAKIGVTTKTAAAGVAIATGTGLRDADAAKFTSDLGGYAVSAKPDGTGLLLVKAHTHFLCGGNSCTKVGHTQETSMVTFKPWDKTNELPTTAGNYYLTDNVTLSSSWKPVDGTVLCLNGHSIKADGNGDIPAILVYSGSITLCDCKGDDGAYGKITHPVGKNGSGVYVSGGRFHMYGGSITGNTADHGGGVYVGGGQFTMYGGEISGNTATVSGGGVSVSGGEFNMRGGTIGGAAADKANKAKNGGGGVHVSNSGEFTMSGSASITGNTADNGGGVYMIGDQFTMYGGEISGNTATVSGGGVDVSGGTFTMSGGRITGNIGSGVFVNDNTTFTVSGAPTVTGNTRNRDIDSNVYLTGGIDTTITIGGALTDGASIGVTKGAGSAGSVIATGATENYSGNFSSDDSTYVVKHDAANNQLVLAVPSAATHTHSWQFTKETGNDSTIFVSCKGTPGSCDYKTTPATVKISMAQSTYPYSENMAAPKATLTYSANWPKDVVKAQENDIKYWRSNDGGTSYTVPVTDKNKLKEPGKYLAQLNFNGKWLEARFSVVDNGKQDPKYTPPTAKKDLVYNGENQPMIDPGSTNHGKMWYKLGTNDVYSTLVPMAKDAGLYTVYYKVEGNEGYNDIAEQSIQVRIEKAKLSGTPTFTKVTEAGKTLKDVTFTKADGWPDGEFKWDNGAAGYDMNAPLVQGEAYSWLYLADNYYAKGTVVLWANPSSGGGSSSGSSGGGGGSSSGSSDSNPVIKTETKNHADGSTTKTETRKDGSVTQTTTGKDGSVSKTETKKDGSSVTENKAADGSTGTVKTDKNGQTEAKTALSSKAIEDAKRNGEAVKAPVEVKATRNSSTAPTVKVELPRNSGETKVEIPVSNVTPGTVAVLVHPDGTEEIVKNSVPTEDGIQLTVDGNATVKIVDNSKGFIDTQDHWAKDAIDFVSARGLVSGMSATIYAPNNSTTRAQLWTILARQNDADLSGGSVWYEKAQNWAKDKGVSDGTDPNAAINRAQMVTMLWRAAGQSAAAGSAANFTDVPTDSYYAQAVAWAVESGITAGVGGGRFDPTATCTRAQIATFLARSMK